MLEQLILLLIVSQVLAYEIVASINCGSYDRTMISSKYANFTGDSFFQGITSIAETKDRIPDGISNLADRQLTKTHRTTNQDYKHFSYLPIVEPYGHHMAIFTFVQTEYRAKGSRIMNIKLGDEIIHTVDIFAEAGYGRILHKSIEFLVRDDVVYFNGSQPALNAYNFRTSQIKFTFEGITGKPKVEALLLVLGTDIRAYLNKFLQYEQEKNIVQKQYLADKYRRIPKLPYRYLKEEDVIAQPESEMRKFITKFISLRSLGCIFCAIFAIHHGDMMVSLRRKLDIIRANLKKCEKKYKGE